jgi:hypothetical protein
MALNRKRNSERNAVENSVDSVVLNGVLSVVERSNKSAWIGTMTDLNSALVRVLGRKKSVVLPKSASSLRVVLNRIANRIRNRSVGVRFIRSSDHSRTRYVRFTQ